MKSRSTWFLWPLILLPLAGATLLYFCYPKLLTGDYAEITVESVTSTRPGEVEIRYRGRISRGTWFDGGPVGRWGCDPTSPEFGRPLRIEEVDGPVVLKIYTIRNDQGSLGTPGEVFQRISVQPGKTYRIRPDRPLTLFRYIAYDGVDVEKSLRVGSHSDLP